MERRKERTKHLAVVLGENIAYAKTSTIMAFFTIVGCLGLIGYSIVRFGTDAVGLITALGTFAMLVYGGSTSRSALEKKWEMQNGKANSTPQTPPPQ